MFGVTLALVMAAVLVPGAPLHGEGENFVRWVEAMVPLLLILFLLPGLAYGFAAGTPHSNHDVARMLPYAIAFAVVWPLLLAVWVALGIPPGPGAPVILG